MISIFKAVNKEKNILTNLNLNEITREMVLKSWIHLVNPSEEEIKKIVELTNINENLLKKSLDDEESAHIEKEEGTSLIVIDSTYLEKVEDNIKKYSTTPLSILFNENFLVTTTLKDNIFVDQFLERQINSIETNKRITLMITLLFANAKNYIQILKSIDKNTHTIETQLKKSMRNKELLDLLDLGKSLVYISTSINSNLIVIEKLRRIEAFNKFEEDKDLLEDCVIETQQAKEMCSIYRDILNGKMDAYASIISNNVNLVMKALAVITIFCTIPTLVASFFGMNVENIPLSTVKHGFLIILLISFFVSIIATIVLMYTTRNNKNH